MVGIETDLHRYQTQLKQGFHRLVFNPGLEQEYLLRLLPRNLVKQRSALAVATILMALIFPLEYHSVAYEQSPPFYAIIRLWVSCPLLLLLLLLSYTDFYKKNAEPIAFLVLLVLGIGLNLVSGFGLQYGFRTIYEGTLLLIFGGFLLTGLRFRYALPANLLIAISYVIFDHFLFRDSPDFHSYFFVFGALLIGGAAAYTLEFHARLGFLQRGALKSLARTDPLTQIANRGALTENLETLIEYARREQKYLTVLLVDVDFFKKYNDYYGHIAGDEALRQVARALSACAHRSFDFVGRYGGEEFLLVWFDTKPKDAQGLVGRVQQHIKQLHIPHEKSSISNELTVSGGMVTLVPDKQTTVQSLIQQADDTLYQAKHEGRNRICMQFIPGS